MLHASQPASQHRIPILIAPFSLLQSIHCLSPSLPPSPSQSTVPSPPVRSTITNSNLPDTSTVIGISQTRGLHDSLGLQPPSPLQIFHPGHTAESVFVCLHLHSHHVQELSFNSHCGSSTPHGDETCTRDHSTAKELLDTIKNSCAPLATPGLASNTADVVIGPRAK